MSVDLTLTAPPDLSVGRVRVSLREREIGAWIASTTQTQHRFEGLEPGIYQAVAEPLGQPSQSFFFSLKNEDEDTQIEMPSLQAMASPGFAIANLKSVAGTVLRGVLENVTSSVQDVVKPTMKSILEPRESPPVALGLSSSVDFERGSMRPYTPQTIPETTLIDNGLELVLNRPEGELTEDSFNLVLTCAVGRARNLYGRIPLFGGGVRIALSASALTADLTCRVFPVERHRRAITQALFAGSSAEAAPVFKTLPGGSEQLIGPEDWYHNPWTSVAACLLCVRFPDLAPDKLPIDLHALAARYPKFADAHVILAHQQLRQGGRTPSLDRSTVLNEALMHLKQGYDAGPPYFAYAAQLAQEMLVALATDAALKERATAQLARLRQYANAPRHAGASYVWRSAEIPARSGTLDPQSATVVFSGCVDHDRIALEAPRGPSVSGALAQVGTAVAKVVPGLKRKDTTFNAAWSEALDGLRELGTSALSILRGAPADTYHGSAPTTAQTRRDPPALGRPIKEADDPHKGRFGEAHSVGGFTLAAKFAGGEDTKLVPITLSVSAEGDFESYEEIAEFFLHPTFRPDRLRAAFEGRKAELDIVAWGGFTVGVWLPQRGIELELDLAKAPGAPKAVREL